MNAVNSDLSGRLQFNAIIYEQCYHHVRAVLPIRKSHMLPLILCFYNLFMVKSSQKVNNFNILSLII